MGMDAAFLGVYDHSLNRKLDCPSYVSSAGTAIRDLFFQALIAPTSAATNIEETKATAWLG